MDGHTTGLTGRIECDTLRSMTIGTSVRRLREARGLSQAALARRAKIGRITLLRIEQGTQRPTLDTLSKIAVALRVDLRELFPPSRRGQK